MRKMTFETLIEQKIKQMHQYLYDNQIRMTMSDKVYLFCGFLLAKKQNLKMKDLENSSNLDDGMIFLQTIETFLTQLNANIQVNIRKRFKNVFQNKDICIKKPKMTQTKDGILYKKESIIEILYAMFNIKNEFTELVDYTGVLLNSLNEWQTIEEDTTNDVIFTPSYVADLMVQLAHINQDSIVLDPAMGSGSLLIAAAKEINKKIENSKQSQQQLFGIELLESVYLLSIINAFLMNKSLSNFTLGDSLQIKIPKGVNTLLLNPPYSSKEKGLEFAYYCLNQMENGYACILMPEQFREETMNTAKQILEHNTLLACIHMPKELFGLKARIQTSIYLFEVARPHQKGDLVTFIDFSNDGYVRRMKKKATSNFNCKDLGFAKERYQEVADLILGNIPKTSHYTLKNGLFLKDTISYEGNDWNIYNHQNKKNTDNCINEEDLEDTISDYFSYRIQGIMKGKLDEF